MKKFFLSLGLLAGISMIGMTTAVEASEVDGGTVSEIETVSSNSTITPYIWASRPVTVTRVYPSGATIPGSIYYSEGSQWGTLYLQKYSFSSNTGLWTCKYSGTISGYI